MSQIPTAFASVKLPAALAAQARAAATRKARPTEPATESQADLLLAQFMAAEANGSLAQRVREVAIQNRSKATRQAD
jgi:hypothetical protein